MRWPKVKKYRVEQLETIASNYRIYCDACKKEIELPHRIANVYDIENYQRKERYCFLTVCETCFEKSPYCGPVQS